MKELLELASDIAARFRKSFPYTWSVQIDSRKNGTEIVFHNAPNYSIGTDILRSFGIKDRSKNVFESDRQPWHTLEGKTDSGVTVRVFVTGLPPTCHIEKFTEKIPKTQTVDTGEFIEVERTKIVCG